MLVQGFSHDDNNIIKIILYSYRVVQSATIKLLSREALSNDILGFLGSFLREDYNCISSYILKDMKFAHRKDAFMQP